MEIIVTKPAVQGSSTEVTESDGVIPQVCKHKNKKGLYKLADIRKKIKTAMKNGPLSDICGECARNDIKSQNVAEWMCVTCGFIGCENEGHAKKHCEADRSGADHVLFLSLSNKKFKCFGCDLIMDPGEDANGPMKVFLDEYFAFKKTTERKPSTSAQVEAKLPADNDEETSEMNKPANQKGNSTLQEEKPSLSKEKKANGSLPGDNSLQKGFRGRMLAVKGLVNLGNTCFFNSTMQCLMHTYTLSNYVDYVGVKETAQIGGRKVSVGDKQIDVPHTALELENFYGPLNDRFAHFIHEFCAGRGLHPSALFSEIAKKAPRFRGWAQQDAHELLRYLLDGLRTEELQRYKDAIADHLKIPRGATSKSVDAELLNLAKGMLKACGRPLLDCVFGGTLLQTVKCSKCSYLSCIYEEFLDLSIPIPNVSASSKILNGTLKLCKSSSSSVSKYQKKKEKAIAKKRMRRKSRRESTSSNRGETPEVETEENGTSGQNESDVEEEEDEAELSDENDLTLEKLQLDDNYSEECLKTLGEEPEKECGRSLYACLSAFTATEILSYPNAYECEKCCMPENKNLRNGMKKKTVEALKRYFIYEPPSVLTLHLKRFEQHHFPSGRVSTSKVRGHVAFPLLLDIAPFCTRVVQRVEKDSREVLYSLYGVVSHSGDLSGGHYVAYVRSRRSSALADKFFCEAAKGLLPDTAKTDEAAECDQENSSEQSVSSGGWFYVSDSRVCAVDEGKVLDAEAYILFYERVA